LVGVHPISETSIGDCFYDDSQFVDFANPKSRGGSTPRPTGGFETARLYQTFESNMAGKSLFYGKKWKIIYKSWQIFDPLKEKNFLCFI
jgi:hypothetical protein